jgi:ribosomal protein S27AE
MSIPIVCMGCGQRGQIEKIAAEVRHDCGSTDVDVWMETPDQLRRVASANQEPTFADFMHVAAAQKPMPPPTGSDDHWTGYVGTDPEPGWDEYAGPGPTPSHMNAPVHTDLTPRAPTRKQPGQVEESNLYVYDKHNPLEGYGETMPPPPVAKHNYPSSTTTTPFLGRHKSEDSVDGVLLKNAKCPTCDARDTSLMADYRDHAHWYCQVRCGSLVDLDKHPQLDPYRPVYRHWGEDAYRRDKRVFAGKKNGQMFRRMATIGRINPGLTMPELVHLARQSVIHYPEA